MTVVFAESQSVDPASEAGRPSLICAQAGALPRAARERNAPFIPPIAQTTLFDLGTRDDAEALLTGRQPGYTDTR